MAPTPTARQAADVLAALGVEARSRLVVSDAAAALASLARAGERFDLCFVDPPYATNLAAETLTRLAGSGLLSERALVVAETDRRHAPGPLEGFALALERRYGDTLISFYTLTNPTIPPGVLPA